MEVALEGLAPAPESLLRDLKGATAYEVGGRYVAALGREVRARHGRHYTPAELAENLWSPDGPSGSGCRTSHCPALSEIRHAEEPLCCYPTTTAPPSGVDADPRVTLAGIPRLMEGVDTDPSAVWLANIVLGAELLPLIAAVPEARRRPLPLLARVGDGLSVPDNQRE